MISLATTTFVSPTATSVGLSQMLDITAGDDPATVTLFAWDRDEYPKGASGQTGSFTGNGQTADFASALADGTTVTLTFSLQPDGQYYNNVYGDLDQLVYNSSASLDDVTNISFSTATSDTIAAILAGYIGSVTVATRPDFTGSVPAQATPLTIAEAAAGFVGQPWNVNGCWILASCIAAEAGASLPLTSTLMFTPGRPSGEWSVAFNGPAGQTGDWQAMVTAGEIIVIGNPDGSGHVATCVAGSGGSAMLVDNIGVAAQDGSGGKDILIAAPHLAVDEWFGVATSSVVIYQLDCPIVTTLVASISLVAGTSAALSGLFAATDPTDQPISSWQVYDAASSDALVMNGVAYQAHSATAALTVSALAAVALVAGPVATTDVLDVRAFNGSFWGDWQSLVAVITAPAVTPPDVAPTPGPLTVAPTPGPPTVVAVTAPAPLSPPTAAAPVSQPAVVSSDPPVVALAVQSATPVLNPISNAPTASPPQTVSTAVSQPSALTANLDAPAPPVVDPPAMPLLAAIHLVDLVPTKLISLTVSAWPLKAFSGTTARQDDVATLAVHGKPPHHATQPAATTPAVAIDPPDASLPANQFDTTFDVSHVFDVSIASLSQLDFTPNTLLDIDFIGDPAIPDGPAAMPFADLGGRVDDAMINADPSSWVPDF